MGHRVSRLRRLVHHDQRDGDLLLGRVPDEGLSGAGAMIRTFIQVAAIGLTLEAALFLARGNLGLTPGVIAELAGTKYGHNRQVIQSLAQQAADTWVGVTLLLIGIVFQAWHTVWPMSFNAFAVNRWGVALALSFCLMTGIGGYYVSRALTDAGVQKAESHTQK